MSDVETPASGDAGADADDGTVGSDDPIRLSTRLPEVIEGPRLRMQIWHPDRAEEMAAAVVNSLDELRPWMPWVADEPRPIAERRRVIETARAEWAECGDGNYMALLDGRLVGAAGLHTRQGPGILEIGYWIDSDHVGRGLATEATRLLTEVAAAHPDIETVEIHHDRANTRSARVAAKAGYVFAGYRPDVVEAPAETGVDCCWRHMPLSGLSIRPEAPVDHESIHAVVEAAFGSPVEAELVRDIRTSPHYQPGLALVAEIDDDDHGRRVVGHVMISGCTVHHDDGTTSTIQMLSPLAVAPDVQRHGIGGALVKAALDGADAAGEPLVIVEGDPAYYGRFGFEPAMDHGLTIHVPDWAPAEAGQVVRLDAYDPGLTGTVVYPEAFVGLD
jgi:putative acetyltransferase